MSKTPETRILFVGDMHLGRRPSSLPADLSAERLGPRHAWERVVDTARDLRVQAVALAGDLVEKENDLFEAYGLLERGCRRLEEAGIDVIAVAGNHDTVVLPRLAANLPHLQLLGPRGTWSATLVKPKTPENGPEVRLVGWSFPASHVTTSPLESPPPPTQPGLVTLGLLHGDLGAPGSSYAPLSRAELLACGYQGWFLGHVHLPSALPTDPSPFYLGSLTALTPGEQGLHGPVLVRIDQDGALQRERLPLAPLRWEEIVIDVSGRQEAHQNLKELFLQAIHQHLAAIETELDLVRAIGIRIQLTGRTESAGALHQALRRLDPEDLRTDRFFVQKIANHTAAAFDLVRLAAEDHPAGMLARNILLLENPENDVPGFSDPLAARENLLAEARRAWSAVDARDSFASLAPSHPNDHLLSQRLLGIARESLALLLDQRGGDHAVD